jgi:TRAP-type mannitol/chloroaromatic compound transport system permease small subunit
MNLTENSIIYVLIYNIFLLMPFLSVVCFLDLSAKEYSYRRWE